MRFFVTFLMLYPTVLKFSIFVDFDFGVNFGPVSDPFLPHFEPPMMYGP